jgi:peptide/nickel transport system permease protein
LVGTSTALAVMIAIPIGVLQAVKRNTFVDHSATSVSFLLYSMPAYIPATLLIAAFALGVHWFPPQAPQQASAGGMITHPKGLVLPIIALTLVTYALFSRYMRSSAIESLAQDYIRTARAKGLPERLVLWRHVLRNSLIPVATLIGLSIPAILTAGLIVEQFFNFPGIGLQYYTAATQDDYPVMLGITVLIGAAVVMGNLLADLAYAVLDPRVRYT